MPLDADQRTSDVFQRALFDSARADAVPERSRHQVALALGLAGPTNGAGSGGTTPSELGGAPPGARSVATGGAARGTLGYASQSLLVVVAGGLAALAFLGATEEEIAPTSAPSPLASAPFVAPLPPGVGAAATVEAPAGAHSSAPSATPAEPPKMPALTASRRTTTSRRAAKSPAAHPAPAPAASAESRLLEEVALLDLARVAVAASDAPLALERLRRYSAEFPEGVLADEARRLEARARSRGKGSKPASSRH
jgi:hypothetical protein